ncbi:MAG: NYN domain-containing protein [Candidatus Zambryskibacteria bacterium]|nr:NYN domain-containing protein [Candidatus Zambryskibacteria bacterium]
MQKRFAFIDVQNTATTTQKLLGFIVDWHKLYEYLKEKWNCEKVFFYSGIDEGDTETAKEFDSLLKNDCVVKAKTVFAYKKPDKTISIKCVGCGKDNVEVVDMGYNRKSNCDVDLTVDAMEMAGPATEFLIFTGDGDFDCLIRKVLEKGTKVYIVSSNAGTRKPGINTKRLSIRLKALVDENRGKVNLIDINSWQIKIKKDI